MRITRKKKLNNRPFYIVLAVLLALVACYAAYDSYFRLPSAAGEENPAENPVQEKLFDKFNVLILGADGRQGVNPRADTIMLASFDADSNEAQLLSIPRDTRVKIKGAWDKVNAAYAYGGAELMEETLNDFLGIKIDRYVIVDFEGLVKMVDIIGGIEIDVPMRMYVPLEGIDLEPGKQHLNGEQILAYTRFRGTSEGDIGRAKRQQEVIQIMLDKLLSAQYMTKLPDLIPEFKENVRTDLSVKEMVALIRLAPEVMAKGLNTQVLPGENKKIDGLWFWDPDLSALANILDGTSERNVVLLDTYPHTS